MLITHTQIEANTLGTAPHRYRRTSDTHTHSYTVVMLLAIFCLLLSDLCRECIVQNVTMHSANRTTTDRNPNACKRKENKLKSQVH